MPVITFHCPHCSTRLRLQDRKLIGRTISCPDCHQPVELQADANSGVVGRPAAVLEPSHTVSKETAEQVPGRHRRLLAVLGSPLGMAWIVATLLSAGLVAWVIVTPPPAQGTSEESAADNADARAAGDQSADKSDASKVNTVEAKLHALYGRVAAYLARTGHWPRGGRENETLPANEQFSWLATLAAEVDSPGPHPHWERAWNDPLNSRFVRQRQDAFLNPKIDKQSGQDRYPASHFVGITGHGQDSELLPGDHPRAGIFGVNRSTSPEDVADGLAHTMMVAGVDEKLGSWAAAGPSAMRGFTTEPYVNGPDGFGTGQADGMFVLMADGSVRFLSAETDPEIIRRLAAKSDGLPLGGSDEDVPVASVDQPASPEPAPPEVANADPPQSEKAAPPEPEANPFEIADLVAELAGGGDVPIEVPLADNDAGADENATDIATRLEQPIARFDQSTPVPARQLLRSLEEMTAVSLELDQLPDEVRKRLSRPVTVSLAETTVGEILAEALQQLGLRYEIRQHRVAIMPSDEAR